MLNLKDLQCLVFYRITVKDKLDFVPLSTVLWFDSSPTARRDQTGEAIRGLKVESSGPRLRPQIFPRSSEITLRNAQVRRISWVRRVRLAGARLSGLLVSAAFRPATYSSIAIGASPPADE